MDLRPSHLKRAEEAAKAAELERQRLKDGLPHLFGFKWYHWAKAFFDSTNRMDLLCAANQISKSSTQHRKIVYWATEPKLWPALWPGRRPRQFWLLYPDLNVATTEWHEKILPESMPRAEFKNHPVYGWNEEMEKKLIKAIRFNSGVTIYVKSYAQDAQSLQSGTVDAIFCDEELPEELYDELKARLIASNGYFHMVFTATLGQMLWMQAIEGKGEQEKFPNAFKQQVSMYDCQTYIDGSPGHFTEERIREIESECRSRNEVLRRVYGRFVREEGRIVPEFDPLRHFIKPRPIPRGWKIYSGVDGGSGGGGDAHPAAYAFVAVRPDYREGWLVHGWRGDDRVTTDGDVVDLWDVDAREHHWSPVLTAYDPSAKDLGTISERIGLGWIKAERGHDFGYGTLNTLFKHGMLKVFDTPELRKFGVECMTVMHETPKRKRKDDLMDGGRYAAASVPWDWSAIKGMPTEEEREKREQERPWTEEDQRQADIKARRGEAERHEEGEKDPLDDVFAEWNEAYGN